MSDRWWKFWALGLVLCFAHIGGASLADGQTPEEVHKGVMDAAAKYRAGNLAEAIQDLEKLRERAPENVDVQAWLGFLYLRSDRPKEAVPLLEMAHRGRPADLEVANNLGAAYAGAGDLDAAERTYAKIVATKPTLFDPWYNLGNIRLKKRNARGAVEALSKAASLRQNDPFVHNNLGVAYEALGDNIKSAQSFVRAANLNSNNPIFLKNAGLALIRAQQFASAVPFLERAVRLEPQNDDLRVALADAYTRLDRRKEALGIYESLADRLASRPAFWFNLGVLRSQNNDADGAVAAYSKALELAPNDLDALNNLGLLRYRRGEYAESRVLFEKLAGLNPSSTQAKLNLAAACLKLGDRAAAAAQWREVLRVNPGNWMVRLNLANVLWQEGDPEGAKAHYDRVLQDNPKSAEALNGVGLYHLRRSMLDAAEQRFRQALAANPAFSPAAVNLSIVLERKNRKSEAIKVLEDALKRDPKNQEIQRNLKRLKEAG